jgi:hypothetical protein
MPTINQLSRLAAPNGADQVPVYSPNSGDARRLSLAAIAEYVRGTTGVDDGVVTLVTSTSVNAEDGQCLVLTGGFSTAVFLPSAPEIGTTIQIVVANGRVDNVVVRNGNLLMGLAENMTLDYDLAAITLRFIDAAIGWRLL